MQPFLSPPHSGGKLGTLRPAGSDIATLGALWLYPAGGQLALGTGQEQVGGSDATLRGVWMPSDQPRFWALRKEPPATAWHLGRGNTFQICQYWW
jgi:hypothetical protein